MPKDWKSFALTVSGVIIAALLSLVIAHVSAMSSDVQELKTDYAVMSVELRNTNKELARFNDQFEQLIIIQSENNRTRRR